MLRRAPGVDALDPCTIDWRQAWFAPYREVGAAVGRAIGSGSSVAQALNSQRAEGVPTFVPAQPLGGEAYEEFVARTSLVPTRDSLHDFFNGLVWLRYPNLKRRINALHAQELRKRGATATRGAVRDALTLFDENGALVEAPDALARALQRHDWKCAFVEQRERWREARIVIVGHALLEKLVQPRKAITAHVWRVATVQPLVEPDPASRPFAPLPVLGIPGWWPGNQLRDFYDDATVFRPAVAVRKGDAVAGVLSSRSGSAGQLETPREADDAVVGLAALDPRVGQSAP